MSVPTKMHSTVLDLTLNKNVIKPSLISSKIWLNPLESQYNIHGWFTTRKGENNCLLKHVLLRKKVRTHSVLAQFP